ncbi:hypothetical protein DMO59_23455 [Salmonella enterica subsp. diarizonae]|nr:hypothetical protein [Salmonella enterica subsp. diarizonae]
MLPLLSLTPDRSTGSREAACKPARKKPAGWRLRGKDKSRASRRSPSFSPSVSDGVQSWQVYLSVGG